jgi:hypothetical protein
MTAAWAGMEVLTVAAMDAACEGTTVATAEAIEVA